MIAFLKRVLKWNSSKNVESKKMQSSHIIAVITGILEDILFWKKVWLSLSFILFINVMFFVCIHKEVYLLNLVIYFYILFFMIDAFETWLKHKHRTTCLNRLADHDGAQLKMIFAQLKMFLWMKWLQYMYLRDTNHTKAFLLMNLFLGVIFLTGQYISGYITMYLLCMTLTLFYKVAPPIVTLAKKIQQNAAVPQIWKSAKRYSSGICNYTKSTRGTNVATRPRKGKNISYGKERREESDVEFEGLIPEVSEIDINLLTIEPESNPVYDERQSLDYWKPNDVPLEEASDSSDNSSSLVTNLSIEKMQSLEKNIETSDSSEDEYMPLDQQQKEKLLSTLEEVRTTSAWSTSAYNALRNITGAVVNMVYTKADANKRQRVSSVDSSDGFEIVEKQDLI